MTEDPLLERLEERIKAVLDASPSEETLKGIKKATDNVLETIESDLLYRLKDELAYNLCAHVQEMVKRAITCLLEGNEDQMKRYLGCDRGWNGRSDGEVWGKRLLEEWHPVIHGHLHESGALALRRAVVDAHKDLLTSERIKDLEDQVKSLVAQVNKAHHEKDAVWERVRYGS